MHRQVHLFAFIGFEPNWMQQFGELLLDAGSTASTPLFSFLRMKMQIKSLSLRQGSTSNWMCFLLIN